jgi:AraC family transcriptional regulator of adaptative response/methylated-DNA-[protein]-cysteine methyltransferase
VEAVTAGSTRRPEHRLAARHPRHRLPRRVWTALRRLRAGTTTTYTDLARRIGQPRAVRAVARACATNTIALAIPCHRVIRTDGNLSGYRWGLHRKRTLLARERAATART